MELKIIFIYCFCSDFLKYMGIKSDPQCKMNQAEIMTVAITAALFYGGNFSLARKILMWNRHIPNMLSESRLNRQLHQIEFSIWETAFKMISKAFQKNDKSFEYLIDSMPIEVCANYRSYRCKILKGKQFIGFCKAKKKFYYGFKLHMITTATGMPIEFTITPASIADITAFKMMEIDLPSNSTIYADKAYTDYNFEDLLYEISNIRLMAERKENAKRQHSGCMRYLQSKLRKRIETTFSEISRLFPRKIEAVTARGFLMKLLIFVFSFALQKFL
jgi:IS5 family transposase